MGWCIWTAILVAMPYGVWNFGPMVPGQIDMGAFSLAVILVVIAGLLEPCFGEEKKHALVHLHVILVRLGWVATAGLVIAESYAFVRGFDGLITEEQVTLNEIMSIVEFACGALAVSCWGVSALGDGICKGAPSREGVVASFLLGSLWPTACMLFVCLWGTNSFLPSLALCLVVLVLALAGGVCFCRSGAAWSVPSLLSGHMAYLAFRSFVSEYRMDVLDAGVEDASFFGSFCFCIVLLSVVLLLHVRWDERRSDVNACGSSGDDCSERVGPTAPSSLEQSVSRMERRLAEASRNTLTEREASVLARTALGATAKTIGSDLGISPASVATYRHRGYEKLCVSGASELRKMTIGLDLTKEFPAAPKSEVCSGRRDSEVKPEPSVSTAVAFACLSMALLVDASNNVQIGGQWYHRGTTYITWGAALALSLVAFLWTLKSCGRSSHPCSEQIVLMRIADTAMSVVLVLVLSFGAYCGWSGMWLYKVWALVLIIVASLAVGKAHACRGDQALPRWRVVLAGFRSLFYVPSLALLGSAGIAIAYHLELYYVGVVTDWIFILFPSLIALFVVVLVYQARVAAVPIAEPTDNELDRAVHYLQGRGIDGMRLNIVLDLVCGYGVSEVCRRRCTTLATVKSYRQRTYDDLGVHSMRDLRKLLIHEAKVTSLEQMHPHE